MSIDDWIPTLTGEACDIICVADDAHKLLDIAVAPPLKTCLLTVPAGYPDSPLWPAIAAPKEVLKSVPGPWGDAYPPVWIFIRKTSLGFALCKSCAILWPSGQYTHVIPVNSSRITFLFSGVVLTNVCEIAKKGSAIKIISKFFIIVVCFDCNLTNIIIFHLNKSTDNSINYLYLF